MTARLGVVGAGSAAAAATYALGTARPDTETTVFEKSRGVCGRAAARRRDGIVYEYGANYLMDADDRVRTLVTDELSDGLVEVDGPIWTFDADGNVSESPNGEGHRWTYEDGITRLAKHLFGRAGVEVHRETRITDVHCAEGWHLVDSDGGEHGPFDALLLTPPAPQTADLLRNTGNAAADRLGNAAGTVRYQTIWTAVLGYDFTVDAPYYGLRSSDPDGDIGWIGREERKPGHVPDGKSVLVVQASPDWSTARYDAPPAQNVAALARHTAKILGDPRLAAPDWSDHQGWKYALPTASIADAGPGPHVLRDAAQSDLYITGDWVAGEARLHAAVRNGLETGEAIARSLASSSPHGK